MNIRVENPKSMHVFSVMEPQQPRNAITNKTQPATIKTIGKADKT